MNITGAKIPLEHFGSDLCRPECVLCFADGAIATADWRGGVMMTAGDGRQKLIAGPDWLRPNGIAMRADGDFVVAHLGDRDGGVYTLGRDGSLREELLEIDGAALQSTNFVLPDSVGRLWITVSTKLVPRAHARHPDIADGFIILKDERGSRIVADRLGFTNEVRFDPGETFLYVAETWGRRLTRFRVTEAGRLIDRETFVEFGEGIYPDGIDFDESGALWVTSVFSNRVLRVLPDRTIETWIDLADADFIADLEKKRQSGDLRKEMLIQPPASPLGNATSIAFGGTDRRTAFLGCLQGDRLATFRAPAVGVEPLHWHQSVPMVN